MEQGWLITKQVLGTRAPSPVTKHYLNTIRSIKPAVLTQLTSVTDRRTDRTACTTLHKRVFIDRHHLLRLHAMYAAVVNVCYNHLFNISTKTITTVK